MDASAESWLAAAIESALVREPGMGGAHIEVEVEGDAVTLRGVVRNAAQEERVLAIARSFGVRHLRNQLLQSP